MATRKRLSPRSTKQAEWLQGYVSAVAAQGSHVGKVHQFLNLLEKLFKISEVDYELEQHVESSELQVRGKIDTVIGDVLFEFKTNLAKELRDAEEQLHKYLTSFKERFRNRPCVGIATDGLSFRVYRLSDKGAPAKLEEIERQDLRQLSDEGALLWLDRYLFRRAPKQPTEEDISARFGATSPTYKLAMIEMRQWWDRVREEPGVAIKYELWGRQLTVVYGEGVGNEELFLQHSYLATFAKLLASLAFRQPVGDTAAVLTGAHFASIQIYNFVEEDLFFWPLHPSVKKEAVRFSERMLDQLREYDSKGFNEDILKGLYQELVDPQVRHDLGEYYTPDWLAQLLLQRVLPEQPEARILDPACGSGTFLFLAIRQVTERLDRRGWTKGQILRHVEEAIVGVDVHPLAVLISRTNYLLACAPLMSGRKGAFRVPVYLGDSLMYRSLIGTLEVPDIEIAADGKSLWFPERLREDPGALDELVSKMVYWAERGDAGLKGFKTVLSNGGFDLRERNGLMRTFTALRELSEEGRDSIWGYVTRNLVRPYILSRGEKFDLVVGNPPWLSLRYIKSSEYQNFVKTRMEFLDIKPKGAKLVTQLDLSALFFAECSHRYLRIGGQIAFVMPRGALFGRQYEAFRKFQFGGFAFLNGEVFFDLLDVRPLFRVPASALICRRGGKAGGPPKIVRVRGRLPRKNTSWAVAKKILDLREEEWKAQKKASRLSPYHAEFRQGASIVPRRFWFIELPGDTMLGVNTTVPPVQSDVGLEAKKPWQVALSGEVEAEFIWSCILPDEILPFVPRHVRPVVVPLVTKRGSAQVELLDSKAAFDRGHGGLGKWMEGAEAIWVKNRTAKAPAKLTEWLDWLHKLSAQFPRNGRYLVLFTKSAAHLTACVLDTADEVRFPLGEQHVRSKGTVIDHTTYWYATNSRDEAAFLAAWLNAPCVDLAIKAGQTYGQFGPRDIHRRPFEFPLPKYDGSAETHRRLADLGLEAWGGALEAASRLPNMKSIATMRKEVRKDPAVAKLLKEIDVVCQRLVPEVKQTACPTRSR